MGIKIDKPQLLKTDINAFKSRQSFRGGLKLPLKETVDLPDEEYNKLSADLRKIKSHAISNLLPYIDNNIYLQFDLLKGATIYIQVKDKDISLVVADHEKETITQHMSLKNAQKLLSKESHFLFSIKKSAAANENAKDALYVFQNILENNKNIIINDIEYTIDNDIDILK